MTTIVKSAPTIHHDSKCHHVNDKGDIEKYRKLVLRSAGLPEDTLFDINNLEIIKLFNTKNTNLIINDNIYQISIFHPFHPDYDIPSSKMLFSLYDVTSKKYAILYESN